MFRWLAVGFSISLAIMGLSVLFGLAEAWYGPPGGPYVYVFLLV